MSLSPSASVAAALTWTASGAAPDGGVAVTDVITGGVFGTSATVTVTVRLSLSSPSETVTSAS